MGQIICTQDGRGNTVWLASAREAFNPYLAEIKERGESYRIVPRIVGVNNSAVPVWTMTIRSKAR
jgi:DNA-binding IclR family transcriptional regulator